MHQLFATVLRPLLKTVRAGTVVEVGAGAGRLTRRLLEESEAVIHAVDPTPQFNSHALDPSGKRLFVHESRSVNIIGSLPRPDVAILDGDPNWYTVTTELGLLTRGRQVRGPNAPVIVVHNIGWPFGRRDGYYEPDAIPPENRAPFIPLGLLPDNDTAVPAGDTLAPYVGVEEGLPHAGVRTAVEDFMAEDEDRWRAVELPDCVIVLVAHDRLAENAALTAMLDELQNPDFSFAEVESVERVRVVAPVGAGVAHEDVGAANGAGAPDDADSGTSGSGTTHTLPEASGLDPREGPRNPDADDDSREYLDDHYLDDHDPVDPDPDGPDFDGAMLPSDFAEDDLDDDRLDALQRRLELLERERADRLRALEDERAGLIRDAVQARAQLEAERRSTHRSASEIRDLQHRSTELQGALEAAKRRIEAVEEDLQGARHATGEEQARVKSLERDRKELDETMTALEKAVAALLDERRRLQDYADSAARSRAWRIGHGLTSLATALTFHRSRGTSALGKLQQQLERPLLELPARVGSELPAPAPPASSRSDRSAPSS